MQTRTKAGRPIWLNVSTIVTPNGSGGPLTIHLFRDVTVGKLGAHSRLQAVAYATTHRLL